MSYDIEDLVCGLTIEAAHYNCIIEPRSEKRAEIMRRVVKECRTFLDLQADSGRKTPQGMAFNTWVPEEVDVQLCRPWSVPHEAMMEFVTRSMAC